jgi:hypothetical protein
MIVAGHYEKLKHGTHCSDLLHESGQDVLFSWHNIKKNR